MVDRARFTTERSLRGSDPCGPGVAYDPCALANAVWTAWAMICSMLAGAMVRMLGCMLVILLVGVFGGGTAWGLDGL